MHRFNSYAHRLTEILLTAFTFTFSPSQVFGSFHRINLFYYFILHSKYGVYLLQKRLQHLSLYTNLLFSNTHSLTIGFPHIGHFFVVLQFLLPIFISSIETTKSKEFFNVYTNLILLSLIFLDENSIS